MADNHSGDIMSSMPGNQQNTTSSSTASNSGGPDIELLKSIDSTLKTILREGPRWSQSDAQNMMPGRRYAQSSTRTGYSNDEKWGNSRSRKGYKSDGTEFKGVFDEFEDGLRDALMEGLFGADLKGSMQATLEALEKELNVRFTDVPKALGKDLGKTLLGKIQNHEYVKSATQKASTIKDQAATYVKDAFKSGLSSYDRNEGTNYTAAFEKAFASLSNANAGRDSRPTSSVQPNVNTSSDSVVVDQYNLISQIATNVEVIAQYANHLISVEKSKQADLVKAAQDSGQVVPDDLKRLLDTDIPDVLTGKSLKDSAASNIQATAADAVEDAITGAGLDATVEGVKNLGATMVKDFGDKLIKMGPKLATAGLAIAAGFVALKVSTFLIKKLFDQLAPAVEGTKELFDEMKTSANRYQTSRDKNLQHEQDRILADVKSMVEAPFKILEEAANEWYQVWNSQLRTINGTQGYNKADLQNLMGTYADRLREEGMTRVVSSADITTNLAKVLESGLSGQVAEEFAYIATKLNAAIPTQDFFNYAETYASLAANSIKNGKSEAEAIAYANEQMELFASNVLYASRQLAGGFSTGLRDAQSIFESSVEIATASRTGLPSEISGVLTSVAAIVGSIAPDLSTSLVDAVVNAAVGGNSSEIVALRSLAGINASNTEFIRALASNPKEVFEELFNNLARLQNMSPDAYMEVAEGVSEIFGLQKEALQRVDFQYLATAISKMNVNNASLDENMKLLVSGQTTTNAEQLKMQQINEYMLEEGLAYVIDNQVAQMIQQHMWEEQIARELMEAEYAVHLQGDGLKFLEGIRHTVDNIVNFLNPFSFAKKIVNLSATAVEAQAQKADVRQLLELGKVGNGNATSLYQLTTTNADLHVTPSIIELMGGLSAYQAVSNGLGLFNALTNYSGRASIGDQMGSYLTSAIQNALTSSSSNNIKSSKYDWATVGKSTYAVVSSIPMASSLAVDLSSPFAHRENVASTSASTAKANRRFQDFINTMDKFVENNQSYDEWKATAYKFGIKDFDAALETYGRSESELMGHFSDREAQKASEYNHNRDLVEDQFWQEGITFWTVTHPEWEVLMEELENAQITNQLTQIGLMNQYYPLITQKQDRQIELMELSNAKLNEFFNKHKQFYDAWVDYYVNHTAYSKATLSAYDVAGIRNAEKKESGDAVLALAKALTSNAVDLKDPVVQTNVLLSQILIVAEAIMQQNNQVGGVLPTALASLGLGVIE